jgi:hypothetical protein
MASPGCSPTRAAGDLREQLERPFGRAKIREPESDVGRHDADQRHARKVVTFGNHLRADEHVDLAVAELREQRGERSPAPDGVAVQPRDARAGACAGDLRFDAFGSESRLLEVRAGAQRAGCRYARGVIAVMAPRPPGMTLAVDDQ